MKFNWKHVKTDQFELQPICDEMRNDEIFTCWIKLEDPGRPRPGRSWKWSKGINEDQLNHEHHRKLHGAIDVKHSPY